MLRPFGAARVRAIVAYRGRNVSGVGHVVVPHAEVPADSLAVASAGKLSAPVEVQAAARECSEGM
jgi:hypothetical protein